MWLAIKSKLALIVTGIISILLLIISALRLAASQKELKREKAVSKGRDKANKALNEGLSNEAKDNTLDYFDDKPK